MVQKNLIKGKMKPVKIELARKETSKRVLFLSMLLLFAFGVSAQSFYEIDSLKTSLEKMENDSLKGVAAIKISREIHRKAHDEEEEYKYAELAIELSLGSENKLLYARALDNLGLLYRYHQYYKESLDLHIKAYKLVEEEDGRELDKMIYADNAGVAARYSQKNDVAIAYYMKALDIAEKGNNLRNIAIASNGIGNALGNIPGRELEALPYFERSLKVEEQRKNSLGMAMNYLSIADVYIRREEFKKAREYLTTLLLLNEKREDKFGIAISNEFFGLSYLEEGNRLYVASDYFYKALKIYQELGNTTKEAEVYSYLGKVANRRDRMADARANFLKALDLGQELRNYTLLQENSILLSEVMEKEGEYQHSLAYYKQGKNYQDSVRLDQQRVEIEALTRQYDLKKKEDQISLLEKDRSLQEAQLANQEEKLKKRFNSLIVMGIGFVMLAVIFFLHYRNNTLKKKAQEKLLEGEKEKMKVIYQRDLARAEILVTRLRINPHFLFNSLNAITYLIQSRQNEKAKKYLVIFSRYTRMVLETSKKQTIPLEEELKLTEYYLTLEENRFEDGFEFEILGNEKERIKEVNIPPMIFQPFLENAIWHGLLPSKKEIKKLKIEIIPIENGLEIGIEDNGVGRAFSANQKAHRPKKNHKSMGMEIIRERIDLYNKNFEDQIDFEIIDKLGENGEALGTLVKFTLFPADVKTVQSAS